jgi:DNA-directed RNA polymerase specialized sigma24 family protein
VFVALEREWGRLVSAPSLCEAQQRWWSAEAALRGAPAAEIVTRVAWRGYSTTAEGAAVLSALLRVAVFPFASRCLLQALAPRIEAENVYTPTFGHRVGEGWRHPSDTAAELVAECFAAIVRHSGEDHGDVARLVVGEAVRRLRTARQAERRHQRRTVNLSSSAAALSVDLFATRSVPEWLAGAVVSALRQGRLNDQQAALLYATRVKGLPASEAGRLQRLPPKAVYHALSMAERALVGSVA